MGFGGINTHVALEGTGFRRVGLTAREHELAATQDEELFLFGAEHAANLGALRGSDRGCGGNVDLSSRSSAI